MYEDFSIKDFVVALKPAITFQHLEVVIKSRIPGLQSLITKTISELETELSRLGKPVAADAGVRIFCLKDLLAFHSSVSCLISHPSFVNTHSPECRENFI
jgi:hypothetical protein